MTYCNKWLKISIEVENSYILLIYNIRFKLNILVRMIDESIMSPDNHVLRVMFGSCAIHVA